MKKHLLLLALSTLLLASCNPISTIESSDTTSVSESSPIDSDDSVQPVVTSSIAVTHNPNKTTYTVGEQFSKQGLEITATLSDGSTKVVTDYNLDITNSYVFMPVDVGNKVITVSYDGKTTTFTLVVNSAILSSIRIENEPTKRVYQVGEQFSLSGIRVFAEYSDGSDLEITSFSSSIDNGYQFKVADVAISKTVTISYKGKTATFTISVNAAPDPLATLEEIEVLTPPTKLNYVVGEEFSLNGIVVIGHYSDNTDIAISEYTSSIASGYTFTEGDIEDSKVVTITHETLETTFTISVSPVPIETLCNQLNSALNVYNEYDAFDARDYLLSNSYSYLLDEYDGEYFGYDYENEQIVIYSMATNNSRVARYPSNSEGNTTVTSYQELTVNNVTELKSAVENAGYGLYNYSVIKLGSSIELGSNDTISITYNVPVEFNLNNYEITSNSDIDIFRINHDGATVSFTGGTISTHSNNTTNVELSDRVSTCCIRALSFNSINIKQTNLHSNARYGYGILDGLNTNASSSIKIVGSNNEDIYAVTNAICVQNSTFIIKNLDIDGIINISGGDVTIEECEITAAGRHDNTEPVTDEYLTSITEYLYVNKASQYSYYTVSATDPIIIFDRRNIGGQYDNPTVLVKDSTLTADYEGNVVLGYGIRYLDLHFDTTKSTTGTVTIDNVTYILPNGYTGSFGGYNV